MTLTLRDFKIRNRPVVSGRKLAPDMPEQLATNLRNAEAEIAQPFKGLTAEGQVTTGLYSLQDTGLSNEGIANAANAWLESLDSEQRSAASFGLDSDAWRRWSNIHVFLMRHGAMMAPMSQAQRDLTFNMLRESFSPAGFELARNIMKLNEAIREITGSDEELGEWLYWMSVMGEPSAEGPWGWQFDGHHLNVNCFLLGGQMVMTPMFMGSEPVAVDIGKHAGTRVFQAEESIALNLARSFSAEQKSKAIVSDDVPPGVFTGAFRDNFEMRYEGIKFGDLSSHQQAIMFDLIGTYINRMRSDHAQLKMDEIREHLGDTHFAWMGGVEEDSVFYYRVHSPVVLIEFDHQNGIFLDNDEPSRNHIHTVVRTPNGNDYGKDLLRQHREQHHHSHD
ncbi:MAG: DUF3500 domain-containing protein [Chloroflexi bacterium]|nr:DUF3500 domain-containing protein [Chloroflexota bacterium]